MTGTTTTHPWSPAGRGATVKGVTVFRSGAEREEVLEAEPLKEECSTECHYVDLGAENS